MTQQQIFACLDAIFESKFDNHIAQPPIHEGIEIFRKTLSQSYFDLLLDLSWIIYDAGLRDGCQLAFSVQDHANEKS